jgi:hypothetical protein
MGAEAAKTGTGFLSVPAKAADDQCIAQNEFRLHRKEIE